MTKAHKSKAKLTITVYIDPRWLNGFCYGTGASQRILLAAIREAIREACRDQTSCRFIVKTRQYKYLTNPRWSIFVTGLAPASCRVRELTKVAADATSIVFDGYCMGEGAS